MLSFSNKQCVYTLWTMDKTKNCLHSLQINQVFSLHAAAHFLSYSYIAPPIFYNSYEMLQFAWHSKQTHKSNYSYMSGLTQFGFAP